MSDVVGKISEKEARNTMCDKVDDVCEVYEVSYMKCMFILYGASVVLRCFSPS
jgi:hypothetical protein